MRFQDGVISSRELVLEDKMLAPHLLQNFASLATSAPQLGQFTGCVVAEGDAGNELPQ